MVLTFSKWSISLGILLVLISLTFSADIAMALGAGYFLGSISLIISCWVIDHFRDSSSKVFMRVFFRSLIIRFIATLSLFAIIIDLTKIDEIYFTVSFIISYLCQSVTEMIFYNKILQRNSSKKQ